MWTLTHTHRSATSQGEGSAGSRAGPEAADSPGGAGWPRAWRRTSRIQISSARSTEASVSGRTCERWRYTSEHSTRTTSAVRPRAPRRRPAAHSKLKVASVVSQRHRKRPGTWPNRQNGQISARKPQEGSTSACP